MCATSALRIPEHSATQTDFIWQSRVHFSPPFLVLALVRHSFGETADVIHFLHPKYHLIITFIRWCSRWMRSSGVNLKDL